MAFGGDATAMDAELVEIMVAHRTGECGYWTIAAFANLGSSGRGSIEGRDWRGLVTLSLGDFERLSKVTKTFDEAGFVAMLTVFGVLSCLRIQVLEVQNAVIGENGLHPKTTNIINR